MANKLQTLVSIDKPMAEKLFAKGVTIFLCASRLDPNADGVYPYPATFKPGQPEDTLDVQASGYTRFCCNTRTGLKTKFYMSVG